MKPHNVRIRKGIERKLKIVATLLDESMLDTLNRLLTQELARVQKGEILLATLQKVKLHMSEQDAATLEFIQSK